MRIPYIYGWISHEVRTTASSVSLKRYVQLCPGRIDPDVTAPFAVRIEIVWISAGPVFFQVTVVPGAIVVRFGMKYGASSRMIIVISVLLAAGFRSAATAAEHAHNSAQTAKASRGMSAFQPA